MFARIFRHVYLRYFVNFLRPWSSTTPGRDWPESTNDVDKNDWPSQNSPAFNDLVVPEFKPGEPWKVWPDFFCLTVLRLSYKSQEFKTTPKLDLWSEEFSSLQGKKGKTSLPNYFIPSGYSTKVNRGWSKYYSRQRCSQSFVDRRKGHWSVLWC